MGPINRRRLLAGLLSAGTLGLSGCIGDTSREPGEGSSDDGDGDRNGGSDDDSVAMTLTLVKSDDDPGPLAFAIDVRDDQLTKTSFPTVDISVENVGDERVEWGYGGSVQDLPVPQGRDDSDPEGLVIGSEGNVERQLMDDEDGCARVEYFDVDDGWVDVALDPGDEIGETYGISGIDSRLEEECPPPGTYRFEFEFGDHGDWGFELRLD